ncbi:hypothetical protein CDD82_4544 [Ophiocordyceps australis]|uniref:ADP-ribosylation factor GTPase-activating protein n=1 Tax=Ophiocordyceps australis TaxID=1399860 RepID=A0A2C5Z661_9HYPO|nr:hypothetical protein CDD82_4544 [Ophiocordyceps australis]
MGNVSSRLEDAPTLYLRDQSRLTITSLVVTSPRKRSSLNIVPNAFPASRLLVSRPAGETAPVEYIQDPEASNNPSGMPAILLKLSSDDELIFTFTFVLRQAQQAPPPSSHDAHLARDTNISGLTYVCASTTREVDNLVTREFHADPNLHKNANVDLVGDYSTNGKSSVSFEWTWKWKPPKTLEDKGGGWRNSCSFVEYDSRAHRLITLASFSYWVSSGTSPLSHPSSPSPPFLLAPPPKIRIASTQSVDSRLTRGAEPEEPTSPLLLPVDSNVGAVTPQTKESFKVDVSCPRPGDDATISDDGPVFRATLKALEQKTGNMRTHMKRVLKKAEQAQIAQGDANEAFNAFVDALREASATNANAVQPALDHYFDKIARAIFDYEKQSTANLQRIIIEPLSRLYQVDIKGAESKKREFDEESKDYYSYVSRYLGQRQDSVKAKKLAESDSKYQHKRRNFELKRFDYSNFVQDLHGGRKEQEVLSHLTKYASAQTRGYLATANKVEGLLPQLEALTAEVHVADKEYQYRRREREEKRRVLETGNTLYNEPEQSSVSNAVPQASNSNGNGGSASDSELGRADSTGSQVRNAIAIGGAQPSTGYGVELSRSPGSLAQPTMGTPVQATKFKGFRDLEERESGQGTVGERKEGLLWALNRPGGHVDPRALNKQAWHKFWIVLDQGKLSEYSNWKQRLDLHMDPIDLRMASVREARTAERRFCFEVITPSFKRVYQATSEEDMNSWIVSINNALQSAMEGRALQDCSGAAKRPAESSMQRDIGSVLTGKTHSLGHGSSPYYYQHASQGGSGLPLRRTTVGARPSAVRTASSGYNDNPDQLLQMVRTADQGNCWCADCGSGSKVEWVSINLGIVLCIECSGIHRSLGTHISKVRSLTLDIKSFTIDIVEVLLLIGNRVSNMIWEARLEPVKKPGPLASREQRLKFITAKYVERAFVGPLPGQATAEEALLLGIKKNEIQGVLHALALRANPNATDKMRGTHAVWLALAAVDPASPSPSPAPGVGSSDADHKTTPFAVAELLMQNGADIAATLPPFPLGKLAQQYCEQKQGRGNKAPASDGLSSLPQTINASDKLQREREARLQKRVSAGGRLAKSPIPEK